MLRILIIYWNHSKAVINRLKQKNDSNSNDNGSDTYNGISLYIYILFVFYKKTCYWYTYIIISKIPTYEMS